MNFLVVGASIEQGNYVRLRSDALARWLGQQDPVFRTVEVENKPEGDSFRVSLGARSATLSLDEMARMTVQGGDWTAWVEALKQELSPGGKVDTAADLARHANAERVSAFKRVLESFSSRLPLKGVDGPVALRLKDAALYDLTPPYGYRWESDGGPFRLVKVATHGR